MGYVLFKRKKFEKSNNVEYHVNNYQVIEGLKQIFKKTERKMNILTYVKELDYKMVTTSIVRSKMMQGRVLHENIC